MDLQTHENNDNSFLGFDLTERHKGRALSIGAAYEPPMTKMNITVMRN